MNAELSLIMQGLAAALAIGLAVYLVFSLGAGTAIRLFNGVLRRRVKIRREPLPKLRWPRLAPYAPNVLDRWRDWSGLPPAAAFALPLLVTRARSRRKKFVEQLPDALDALVSALRVGYALPAALTLVERETRAPVREVFGALARAHEYQLPLKDAVALIRPQLRLPEWDFVAEALRIHESIGGNFVPVLTQVAASIRDKQRIEAEVATATASGRFSGMVVAALAPLSFIAFSFLSPSYLSVLFTSSIGQLFLGLAIFLEVLGFFLIWKIVTIDY